MPWYNGDYPPSYRNQPVEIRTKATEIANELLLNGVSEGVAITNNFHAFIAGYPYRNIKSILLK